MDRLEASEFLKDKPSIFFEALQKQLNQNPEYTFIKSDSSFLFNWLDFSFILKHQIVSPHKCILFKTYEIIDSETAFDVKEKKYIKELDFTIKTTDQDGGIYLIALINAYPEDRFRQDTDRLVASFIKKYMVELEKTITNNYKND